MDLQVIQLYLLLKYETFLFSMNCFQTDHANNDYKE